MHIRNKFEKFLISLAALSSMAIIAMIFKIQQDRQALSDLASSQSPDPQTDTQQTPQATDSAVFPIDNTTSQPATDSGIYGQPPKANTDNAPTVTPAPPTAAPKTTTVQPAQLKASTSSTSSSSSSSASSSSNKKTSSSHH